MIVQSKIASRKCGSGEAGNSKPPGLSYPFWNFSPAERIICSIYTQTKSVELYKVPYERCTNFWQFCLFELFFHQETCMSLYADIYPSSNIVYTLALWSKLIKSQICKFFSENPIFLPSGLSEWLCTSVMLTSIKNFVSRVENSEDEGGRGASSTLELEIEFSYKVWSRLCLPHFSNGKFSFLRYVANAR